MGIPAHLQLPTVDGKRPLEVCLDALHKIAGWHRGEGPLNTQEKVAREVLAALGVTGAPKGGK